MEVITSFMFLSYSQKETPSDRKDVCVAPEAALNLVVKRKPYLSK